MYMAKASSTFRTLSNLSFPLEKVVYLLNNEIVEAKFKGMFVTAVFGKLNIKTGDVTFVNAGHESIMVVDRNKNFEFIKSELPPIGIIKYFAESKVKSKTINLNEKTFVVYTDGVTEGYLTVESEDDYNNWLKSLEEEGPEDEWEDEDDENPTRWGWAWKEAI